MKFITTPVENAIADIASKLGKELKAGKHVLWLTSGGSCVEIQTSIRSQLAQLDEADMKHLTVLPIDERYGKYGHADSNSAQMRSAGFKQGAEHWIDILGKNALFQETLDYYSNIATDAFAEADVVVATLGMGADGHIAGILPKSPAAVDTVSTAVGFTWSDYERLTLGISMLLKIDNAWLLAYGESKKTALQRLQANAEPVEDLPAKLLYELPDVTVYNDYITS